jgi:hypothetical protein
MSRFGDYEDDSENWALNMGRWQHNAHVALKGKRGRKALAELREALMALPEHKLIEGAVCTVGADRRRDVRPGSSRQAEKFDKLVQRDGEGVCGVGAYVWYRKVKSGVDPADAFASLPDLVSGSPETAYLGEDAGLTYTLAWELAYRNDEEYAGMTPEQRHAAFIAWIDAELASTA